MSKRESVDRIANAASAHSVDHGSREARYATTSVISPSLNPAAGATICATAGPRRAPVLMSQSMRAR